MTKRHGTVFLAALAGASMRLALGLVAVLAFGGCGGGHASRGPGVSPMDDSSDLAGLGGFERGDACRARGAPQPAAEPCPLDPGNSFNGMPLDAPTRIESLFEQGMPEMRCCWAGHESRGQEVPLMLQYEVGREQPSVLMPAFAAPPDVVDCLTKLVSMWTFPPACATPDATAPAGAPLAQLLFPIRF